MARGYECGCWQSDDGSFRLCLMHEEQNKMPPDPDTQERGWEHELDCGCVNTSEGVKSFCGEHNPFRVKRRDECAYCGVKQSDVADLTRKAEALKEIVEKLEAEKQRQRYIEGDWNLSGAGKDSKANGIYYAKSAQEFCDSLLAVVKGGDQ